MTTLWVPRETRAGERRVAASPEIAKKLAAAGFEVRVEKGAGEAAGFTDAAYAAAGATTAESADWAGADVVLKVAPPTDEEAARLRSGAWLFAHPFLTSHVAHLDLPLLGELHLPTAFLFDIGVFALVVGATTLILIALAHQSLRGDQPPRRL